MALHAFGGFSNRLRSLGILQVTAVSGKGVQDLKGALDGSKDKGLYIPRQAQRIYAMEPLGCFSPRVKNCKRSRKSHGFLIGYAAA